MKSSMTEVFVPQGIPSLILCGLTSGFTGSVFHCVVLVGFITLVLYGRICHFVSSYIRFFNTKGINVTCVSSIYRGVAVPENYYSNLPAALELIKSDILYGW